MMYYRYKPSKPTKSVGNGGNEMEGSQCHEKQCKNTNLL